MNKKVLGIGISVLVVVVGVVMVIALRGNDDSSMDSMKMDSSGEDTMSSEMAAPNTVIIDKLDFQQKDITVKKGTVVTWKNNDTAKHNVVFDDESSGTVEGGKLISQGETLTFTFNEAGEFPYHCEPHPFMKAKIIVT